MNKTRYPLFLAHGTGFRDDNPLFNYWGRIPKALRECGAQVYYGGQDSWATIETNAAILKQNLLEALRISGAEKVNIIAHSKGGLEARYMISCLGMASHVASLTTISTPHHGSKSIDLFYDVPAFLYRLVAFFVDLASRIIGDRHPDFYTASRQLSLRECRAFNDMCPDAASVFYQSYSARMRYPFSDLMYVFMNIFVKIVEGDNDGLVADLAARGL